MKEITTLSVLIGIGILVLVVLLIALGMDRTEEKDEEEEYKLSREQYHLERIALLSALTYLITFIWE